MKPKPRFRLIPVIGILIAIGIGVSLFQTVRRNISLRGQVKDLEAQIGRLEEEKEELSYRIQYFQTDSFKEKEARAKLGLQQPGEGVIILPRNEVAGGDPTQTQEKTKSNPRLWWEFLFG